MLYQAERMWSSACAYVLRATAGVVKSLLPYVANKLISVLLGQADVADNNVRFEREEELLSFRSRLRDCARQSQSQTWARPRAWLADLAGTVAKDEEQLELTRKSAAPWERDPSRAQETGQTMFAKVMSLL